MERGKQILLQDENEPIISIPEVGELRQGELRGIMVSWKSGDK